MRLLDLIDLQSAAWGIGPGPGVDHGEIYLGFQPIGRFHPPSLRNPQEVKIPTPQDGWKKGDSKQKRAQAVEDLAQIHQRLRRQIGKPEVSRTALMPVYNEVNI